MPRQVSGTTSEFPKAAIVGKVRPDQRRKGLGSAVMQSRMAQARQLLASAERDAVRQISTNH